MRIVLLIAIISILATSTAKNVNNLEPNSEKDDEQTDLEGNDDDDDNEVIVESIYNPQNQKPSRVLTQQRPARQNHKSSSVLQKRPAGHGVEKALGMEVASALEPKETE
ncbi:uncharacterized protein LOC119599978 [Lucilia sericata]|uniref:uncharacterized protein LOC119599978 n=1 Tax=Lucilia sericata TaxID=13632 RepID=UPI0018A86288|nr:uncharacterized protein LOC119599978 [Lucilia sericata]